MSFCTHCSTPLSSHKVCPGCDERVCRPPPSLDEGAPVVDDDDFGSSARDGEIDNPFAAPNHFDVEYCFLQRHRGARMQTFQMFRETDGAYIMSASMPLVKDGMIIIHTRRDVLGDGTMAGVPATQEVPGFLCAVCASNYLGCAFASRPPKSDVRACSTEFLIKTNLAPPAPKKQHVFTGVVAGHSGVHAELGLVSFQPHVFTSMPFTLSATLRLNPLLDPGAEDETPLKDLLKRAQKVRVADDRSLFERFTKRTEMGYQSIGTDDMSAIASFESKKPEWSGELGSWTLDFNGRVPRSSKRNFLLVPSRRDERDWGEDIVCLRFGKTEKHRFALDYRFPFSPVTALATAVSEFAFH